MANANFMTRFGNDLYTGARSLDFIGKRRIWFTIAIVLILASVAVPFIRGGGNFLDGFNFGIDFRGGSQFQISNAATTDSSIGEAAVHAVVPTATIRTSTVGTNGVRIQTDQMTDPQTQQVTSALETAYKTDSVTSSFIGATWGADVTRQSLIGLVVFLVLAAVLMAVYFRTWKMSLAAMIALLHDVVITIGVYAATGFEITPAAVIGFLTILGYSLYDTVVVFDKIRENTSEMADDSPRTFGETVNLAVNQTLVRSINTGVVAALPTAAILFLGSFALGADTLRDISLALLVGTIVGTYSTPFIAAPLYAWFRQGETGIKSHDKKARDLRSKSLATA